jgi:hypothetical protein
MSYGSIGTGLGAPVGGATTNFGSTSNSLAPAAGTGLFDFGSTLDSNLLLDGLGKVLQGTGEVLQSVSGGPAGSTSTNSGSSVGDGSLPRLGAGILDTPAGQTGGLDGLTQSLGGPGTGGDLNSIIGQLNDLVNQLQTLAGQVPQQQPQAPAPAPAPQPPVDPIANLVNQANVDPQLRNAVTQVAQDPVGNRLLQGAVNDGLAGIQVANMPAGFFGQTLPPQKLVQIAPQTIQGPDLLRTVAHELVHAATLRDGDSIREENLADQIGTQVQQRLTGLGPTYILGGDAYNGLPQDNGIADALRRLGITV